MALSDCERCWETPCVCGWEYRNYSNDKIKEMIKAIIKYKDNKEEILKELIKELK
jgi:hypothetical protein